MKNNNKFNNLDKIIKENYTNIAGVTISKNGNILYEKYFNNYYKDDTIHIASVTKSIISILVGIAIDKGYIDSVRQKVLEFFPEYKIKRGEKIIQTIRIQDLLTMTAPYKYKYEPYSKVYSSKDWTKAALDLLGGKRTVGEFKYSTVGTHILSGILTNTTGMALLEFASEYLFKYLKIEVPDNIILENKEAYMAFVKGKYVNGWVVDSKGVNTGGWGLCLKLKDMIKIGQLFLNNGIWNDMQIVSKDWIKESTRKHSSFRNLPYGYLWWIIEDETYKGYAAIGDGGNIIYVCHSKGLVVAITSSFKPRAKDRIEFIKKNIIPGI
jgi:CubicO group peptidase (beta-lactamase class C family)